MPHIPEVTIGKNCIVCAHVVISGFVNIGDQVWLGPNSSLKELIKIGNQACVGIGSNIIRDIKPAHVVAGNPARILQDNNPPHLEPLFGEIQEK